MYHKLCESGVCVSWRWYLRMTSLRISLDYVTECLYVVRLAYMNFDSELEQFVKIGEGVYGEVFRYVSDGAVTIVKVCLL